MRGITFVPSCTSKISFKSCVPESDLIHSHTHTQPMPFSMNSSVHYIEKSQIIFQLVNLAYPCRAEGGVGHEAGWRRGQGVWVRHHGHGVRLECRGSSGALPRLQCLNFTSQHQPVKALQVLWGDQASHFWQQGELREEGTVGEKQEGKCIWCNSLNETPVPRHVHHCLVSTGNVN